MVDVLEAGVEPFVEFGAEVLRVGVANLVRSIFLSSLGTGFENIDRKAAIRIPVGAREQVPAATTASALYILRCEIFPG